MPTTELATLEDHELMVRVVDGDVRAFEARYDRHNAQVLGLALRVTGRRRAAEEATQDASLSLWRAAAGWDETRATLTTWLLAMVRNRSVDWLRREARHDRDLESDGAVASGLQAGERPAELASTPEDARQARELLICLPPEQREVVELAYFNGLTQTEIAVKVGIPLGTVNGRQRLALTKMHHNLTGVHAVALSS